MSTKPPATMLKTTCAFEHAYTHAPALHTNVWLAGMQVLMWLLFHPSAWRNYVPRVAPDLPPDFCLGALHREHWRNPAIRQLVLIGYGLWPLFIGGLVGLTQAGLGWPVDEIVLCVLDCVLRSVTTSIGVGIAISLAAGMVSVVTTSAAVGIAYILNPVLIINIHDSSLEQYTLSVAVGITLNIAANIAAHKTTAKRSRQIGSVVLGSLMGCIVLGLTNLVAVGIAKGVPSDIKTYVAAEVPTVPFTFIAALLGGMLLGVGLGWRIRNGRRGRNFGLALGLIFAVVSSTPYAIERYVKHTLGAGLVQKITTGIRRGMWYGVRNSAYFTLPYMLTEPVGRAGAGAIAGALAYGSLESLRLFSKRDVHPSVALAFFSLSLIGGLTFPQWRSWLLYPLETAWNALCYHLDRRQERAPLSLLRWHAAFWDEHQGLPLRGLDRHLLLVLERHPNEGQAALDYVANSRQRWAAQAAQVEMDARALEECEDVHAVARVHQQFLGTALESPTRVQLQAFLHISQDIHAALNYTHSHHQRLSLATIAARLAQLAQDLSARNTPYDTRLYAIAYQWQRVITQHIQTLVDSTAQKREIENPHLVDVPLTLKDAVFVQRPGISMAISDWLQQGPSQCVLLYGQRRVGKTSLLNNLGRLLPTVIVPCFVDLQGVAAEASSHAGLFYKIAQEMTLSAKQQRNVEFPSLFYESLSGAPQAQFMAWLDKAQNSLGQADLLLILDEYESLDRAMTQGRFEADTVLELLSARTQFKILLSGSHLPDLCPHWAAYFPDVPVIHIGYLEDDEACHLIEHPVPNFALHYTPEAVRRVLALTRGHPALVQRLCSEIVALKNSQSPARRYQAGQEDVAAAAPSVLAHGSLFFAHIQQQVGVDGARLLHLIAQHSEHGAVSYAALAHTALARQFSQNLDRCLNPLLQSELIEQVAGGYRFQVELIRRWFEAAALE